MTTYTETNTADLKARLESASGGDIIQVDPGNYGPILITAGMAKTSELIVRPTNRGSPPVFTGVGMRFPSNTSNITIDGINFISTITENDVDGSPTPYPGTDDVVRFDSGSHHLKLLNCTFRFHRNTIKFQNCRDFVEVGFCDVSQVTVDPLMIFGSCNDVTIHDSAWHAPRVNPARRTGAANLSRHPDFHHIRVNDDEVGTANNMKRLLIERCWYDDPTGYCKGIFTVNEGTSVGVGFVDAIIRNCDIRIGRYAAIEFEGTDNVLIENVRVRRYDTGVGEQPMVVIEQAVSNGAIIDCCLYKGSSASNANGYLIRDGATTSNFTLTGNKADDTNTLSPTSWTQPILGVNIGPYAGGGGGSVPETPDEEWSNPPTNTTSFHGRFGTYAEVTPILSPKRWTGVLIIPTTSPMHLAAKVGSELVSGPAINVEWSPDGTNWKPMRFAVPAINAVSGAVRIEMLPNLDTNDALSVWSTPALGTMSGLRWRWKPDGTSIWSLGSTYTGGFTAPAAPDVPTLAALTAAQWAMVSPPPTAPGYVDRFIAQFTITPAVPYTGAQWTPEGGDGIWRECDNVSAGPPIKWQTRSLTQGGIENTVQYSETKSIRVRYGDGTSLSPQSDTAKSFTGPPAPPVTGYDPGDVLSYVGNSISASGVPLTVPYPNSPGIIQTDEVRVEYNGTTITVTLPPDPPPGAVGQHVLYAGGTYEATDGIAIFTAREGATFGLARAYDNNTPQRYGPCLYFFIPDATAGTEVMPARGGFTVYAVNTAEPLTFTAGDGKVTVTGSRQSAPCWYRLSAGGTWTLATGNSSGLGYEVTGLTNNSEYEFNDATDVASTLVTPFVPSFPPVNTVEPTISGGTTVGSLGTCSTGTWTGSPAPTYAYQWQRNTGAWVDLAGATANTYTYVTADGGSLVRCRVTASNVSGSTVGYANAVSVTGVAVALPPPTYDGGMDAGLGPWPQNVALTPYDTSQHASGGNLSYTMTGLPAGLSFNTSTGVLSGTPTTSATSSVTWTVSNSGGSVSDTFNIVIGTGSGAAPVNTVAPVVSGSTSAGSVLTCTDGTWTGSPTPTITKQWQKAGVNISGQTGSTYTTVSGDIGSAIRCVVTGTNASGSVSANSNAITVDTAANPPVLVVPVTLSGTPAVGQVLTTTDGGWSGDPAPTFTYQWQKNLTSISGQTANTYTVVSGDAGASIRSRVTATNASGSVNAFSPGVSITGVAAPVNTVAPVVSGATFAGSVLTCDDGTWTGSPTPTFTRQWQKAGVNISSQTGTTYTTVSGDIGSAIRCVVTGTNASGSASANSNAITVTAAAAVSATSHSLYTETNVAPTMAIGAHDAARRVWATVMVGGAAAATGFNVTGGPAVSVVASAVPVANRVLEVNEITGATGTTVNAGWAGDTESAASFRTIGLQPKTGGGLSYIRQAASNTTGIVPVSVPVGGALLIHGKRFATFTTDGPTITVDESVNTGNNTGCRGAWVNTTGSVQAFNVTFTVPVAMTEKFGLCFTMEPIP